MKTTKVSAYESKRIRLEEAELPEITENEVLIESYYTAISPGTELYRIYEREKENIPGSFPFYPGYSGCGKVIAKGDKVQHLNVGDMVGAPLRHWSHMNINTDHCVKLPDNLCPKISAPFKVAAISLYGVARAEINLGEQVAVIGLGPIGNLAAQFAVAAGAGKVTGFDYDEQRRKLAEKCGIGATEADCSLEEIHNRYDVVIEATGNPEAIKTAYRIVGYYGRVILLGSSRGLTNDVDFYQYVHGKGVSLIGAHVGVWNPKEPGWLGTRQRKDAEAVFEFLAGKRINIESLISENVKPENAQNIYDRLVSRKEPLMLAVYDWKGI